MLFRSNIWVKNQKKIKDINTLTIILLEIKNILSKHLEQYTEIEKNKSIKCTMIRLIRKVELETSIRLPRDTVKRIIMLGGS